MNKLELGIFLIVLATIVSLAFEHFNGIKNAPTDAIRIAWVNVSRHESEDISTKSGRVYFIFTHKGIFYFDCSQGEIFKLTDWKQLGKDHQAFVMQNCNDLIKKYTHGKSPFKDKMTFDEEKNLVR